MGANRAQRRRQEREQMRDWMRMDKADQVLALQKNGITTEYLDQVREEGYRDGYMYASEKFLRKMYAAIAQVLLEAGNSNEDIITFVKETDHKFAVMFDAEDEIQRVYEQTGLYFNVDRNALDRVQEVRR